MGFGSRWIPILGVVVFFFLLFVGGGGFIHLGFGCGFGLVWCCFLCCEVLDLVLFLDFFSKVASGGGFMVLPA